MNYQEAQNLKRKNMHLIGKTLLGGTIDDVYIYPNDDDAYASFSEIYIGTRNADRSILPFVSFDLRVAVLVNGRLIRREGILLRTDLFNLAKEDLGVDLNIDE
jgi:hypothetical protein